jgi:hypothetical protein
LPNFLTIMPPRRVPPPPASTLTAPTLIAAWKGNPALLLLLINIKEMRQEIIIRDGWLMRDRWLIEGWAANIRDGWLI